MDQLHDLALGVAQRILAAGTEAERYELGVEEEDCSSGEDLVELAMLRPGFIQPMRRSADGLHQLENEALH